MMNLSGKADIRERGQNKNKVNVTIHIQAC